MSTVYFCDGTAHALAEGGCEHVFAAYRVTNEMPVKVRDLCRTCLVRHVESAVGPYRVEPVKS